MNYRDKILELKEMLDDPRTGLKDSSNTNKTRYGILALFETAIAQALAEEKERVIKVEEKYHELIMAVGKKYEGETRHETALKYIRSAEKNDYRPDGGNGGGPGVGHNNGGGYGSCSRCLGALGLNGPLGVPKCRCGPLKY